jgi:presenilin-like A22 family membrane protease
MIWDEPDREETPLIVYIFAIIGITFGFWKIIELLVSLFIYLNWA